ncbi:MAG: hypothetical protein K6G04_04820 [Lachnospiraceae bacterium]|nr:hypothetical protein [Lachnospiraceae bacterium]
MNNNLKLPKRLLAALLLTFVALISSVCVVNSSGPKEDVRMEEHTEVAEEIQIPTKEEQISKHTQPIVEVDDIETPLSQTTIDSGYSMIYCAAIMVVAVLICVAASYRKKHRKTSISLRRNCKRSGEDVCKDREIDG